MTCGLHTCFPHATTANFSAESAVSSPYKSASLQRLVGHCWGVYREQSANGGLTSGLPSPAHDPMLANTFEPSLRRCLRFFTPRPRGLVPN